jgi:P2 family phage contractile tail tube protein
MAGNKISERLVNFRVYDDGNDLLGVASVDLPELSAMTDTVSGAGVAGEVESPVLGHFGSMETTITWRTIEPAAMKLAEQGAHPVEVRGSQQSYDAASGKVSTVPVRAVLRLIPKSISLGTFEPGSTTDTETTFETVYIKLYVDKKAIVEIDKYNFKCVINGVDYLEKVREDLGLN